MLEIFVLRHGEAGTRLDEPEKDHARGLTPAGRREIEVIGGSLPKLSIKCDLIASSPSPRALQTAEIVARRFKMLNKLEQWDELKPSGEAQNLYRRLSRQKPGSRLLIVGHEPQLSEIIGEIISGSSGVNVVLKKSGLAKVKILGFKPRITGELRWLLTPRLIKRAAK
jgi:phosphohistidine phosphatase